MYRCGKMSQNAAEFRHAMLHPGYVFHPVARSGFDEAAMPQSMDIGGAKCLEFGRGVGAK